MKRKITDLIKIDHRDSVPKYFQLKSQLLKLIINGYFKANEKVFSDNELMKIFNISRATVRHALAELCNEGILYREIGNGTFVARTSNETAELDTQNRFIGVLIPDMGYFFAPVIKAIQDACHRENCFPVFMRTDYQMHKENTQLRRLLKREDLAGLVIFPINSSNMLRNLTFIKKSVIPFIIMDCVIEGLHDTPFIIPDNVYGIKTAYKYLADKKHKRIGYIDGDSDGFFRWERLKGFKEAQKDYNIKQDENLILQLKFTKQSAVQAMKLRPINKHTANINNIIRYLKQHNPPSAVICINDIMAYAVMEACEILKIKIPDELAVIGYDNEDFTQYTRIPLTTIESPKYELGEKAINMLFAGISNNGKKLPPDGKIILKPKLIKRSSA